MNLVEFEELVPLTLKGLLCGYRKSKTQDVYILPLFIHGLRTKNSHIPYMHSEFNAQNKHLVWHSHNFLLPCITVEEYFIISSALIFNLSFLCFGIDELPAFIIIVYNF